MFSAINTILLIVILVRLFKYDKFYVIKNSFQIKEAPQEGGKQNVKKNKNKPVNNNNAS